MNLQVLGCAGGIGGRERHTTCLRLDNDILLDAGTGLTSLNLEQLAAIDHIFITHSHLDHVAGLALLIDAIQTKRSLPVTVYATEPVLTILKKHLFNWALWPDFTEIPTKEKTLLRLKAIEPGSEIELNGRVILPYSVNHTSGSVAYWIHNHTSGFLFTGDLASTPELWKALAQEKKLSKVIVDCSFPNSEAALAAKSFHFCPQSLLDDIQAMPYSVDFLIYHLKPGQEDLIMNELEAMKGARLIRAITRGDEFIF
ncbi:MAG: 3',5'-cyclic-nucleotide phosphodiesterase [Pseudomonadota bacterium]